MHHFLNFKSFSDSKIDLLQPVTLLIGTNGSGKTNAIEGVELLANLANGRSLHEITDIGRGVSTFQIRGGLTSCPKIDNDIFTLGLTAAVNFQRSARSFEYFISIKSRPKPSIFHETLTIGSRNLFTAQSKENQGDILTVQYDNFARGGNKPRISTASDRSIISRYEGITDSIDQKNKTYKDAQHSISIIRHYLQASFVFDPNPKAMREYERIGQTVLAKDGSNISSILHSLSCGTTKDKDTLSRILNYIRQLPEEPFDSFGFATTQQNDVLFGFRDSAEGPLIDARLISDGTLRCLAVITALETVPEYSRIVVEEFDNGLHPSRVQILANAVWDACKRRNLNALVTTHNPATLDTLTIDQLKNVVLCYWNTNNKSSQLLPILSLPRADTLISQSSLGNLITKKVLEKHLMPSFEEKQREIAKNWLESIK